MAAEKFRAPRGTRDLMGQVVQAYSRFEAMSRETFQRWNYEEIRTPLFEEASLFVRSLGETTDVVEKEIYTFQRKKRTFALRPEGTASVVRAYIERALFQKKGVNKLFYQGSMYRADRPQAGRYREFFQVGAEFFGVSSAAADAEIVSLAVSLIRAAGVKNFKVYMNSIGCLDCRSKFRSALRKYLTARQSTLCENCQRRLSSNPLRVLDCKRDGSRLEGFPRMVEDGFLCEKCQNHWDETIMLLRITDVPYCQDPRLVRGLDYYTGTVFEIRPDALTQGEGPAQDALGAGGRYDGLVKNLGGPQTPATGFALGVDRILEMNNQGFRRSTEESPEAFVAVIGQGNVLQEGFKILSTLRRLGFRADGCYADRSLRSQMRMAENFSKVIILGQSEYEKKCVIVKNMKTGIQEEVDFQQLNRYLNETT